MKKNNTSSEPITEIKISDFTISFEKKALALQEQLKEQGFKLPEEMAISFEKTRQDIIGMKSITNPIFCAMGKTISIGLFYFAVKKEISRIKQNTSTKLTKMTITIENVVFSEEEKENMSHINPEYLKDYRFKLGKKYPSIKKQLKSQGLKIKGKKIDNMANFLYAIEYFVKKGEKDKIELCYSQYALLIDEINKKIDKAIEKKVNKK